MAMSTSWCCTASPRCGVGVRTLDGHEHLLVLHCEPPLRGGGARPMSTSWCCTASPRCGVGVRGLDGHGHLLVLHREPPLRGGGARPGWP